MVLLLASMARPKGVQGPPPASDSVLTLWRLRRNRQSPRGGRDRAPTSTSRRESNTRCEVIQLEQQVEFEGRIRENLQRHEDGPSVVIFFPENRPKIGACPSLNTNRTTRVINGVPRSCAVRCGVTVATHQNTDLAFSAESTID